MEANKCTRPISLRFPARPVILSRLKILFHRSMVYTYLLGELVFPEMFPCLDQDALFDVPPLNRQEGDEVVHETLLDDVGVMETPVFAECALRNQSFQVPESITKLNLKQQYK